MVFSCCSFVVPTSADCKTEDRKEDRGDRGLGEVKISTKSVGRGICNVKFRLNDFLGYSMPKWDLWKSPLWVNETQTVPGREAVRTVAQTTEERDALGLKPTTRKLDPASLSKMFPDGTENIHMESVIPQWYLLEHHYETRIELCEAIKNMKFAKADKAKKNEQMHKAILYSLINCLHSLAALHDELERSNKAGKFAVRQIGSQIAEARVKAEGVFKDVLSQKDRADATRNALSVLTRFKFIFFLSKTIEDNMKKGEYLTTLNDYMRAKSLYKDTEVTLFKEYTLPMESRSILSDGSLGQQDG